MSEQWPEQAGGQPPVQGQSGPPVAGEPIGSWPGAGGVPVSPRATQQTGWGGVAQPAGGPPPPPQGSSPKRAALFVAIVLVVALVAGATTFLLVRGSDDTPSEVAAATTTAPSVSSTVPPALTAEEIDAEVALLSDFVAQTRGLEFLEPVEVVIADDVEFTERLTALVDEDVEAIELQGRLLAALGILGSDIDYVAANEQLLSEGVLGFYNRETDELVVRGTELTPYVRQTIVHELVHALDDQHFELYRPEYEDLADETEDGFISLVEGSARYVEQLWETTLTQDELHALDREEARYALEADLGDVPPTLISLLIAPYEEGLILVEALLDQGGMPALDAALVDPPTTTEQVRHPDRFLAGDERVEVAPPPVEGELLDEGVFGERMIAIMLGSAMDAERADAAADGWAGDWYVGWETPEGGTCVRLDVLSDDAAAHLALIEAFETYAFDLPQATVEELAPTTTRFTSCTPPAGGGGAAERS